MSRSMTSTLLLLLLAGSANAGVPDPRFSTVPTCWTLCPAGDLATVVTIRDVSNAPLANVVVDVDLCSCASVHLCPPTPNDGYMTNGCHVLAITNVAGQATFALRGGGGCTGPALVYASGVLMASITTVASPDQNGNLGVDAADVGLLAAKHGGADRTGDLTCDGAVDTADDAAQVPHLGHACANQTPVQATTWGLVRSLYR